MATLLLTEEEKRAKSWLSLDDESLGKAVKATIDAMVGDDAGGALQARSAALFLATLAHDSNSEELTVTLEGVTDAGKHIGDWKVTVRRVSPEEKYQCECDNEECGWSGLTVVGSPCPECGDPVEPQQLDEPLED